MTETNPRKQQLDAQRRRTIEKLMARISAVNRPDLQAHVEEYVNRCKLTSVEQFVVAVLRADQGLQGSFRDLDVEAARKLVAHFRGIYSPASVRARVVLARQHLRWLFGVKRLDEQGSTCPNGKAIERALNVARHKMKVVGIVLTRQQQDRLVASIPKRSSVNPPFPMEIRDAWILRGLKGTGDRVSEFISIRLRGVRFENHDDQAGKPLLVARLEMDDTAPDLKTGDRAMYVREGVAELQAWLKVHPAVRAPADLDWTTFDGSRDAHNPDAPLTLRCDRDMSMPIGTEAIRKLIKAAVRWAGLDKELRDLSPHDFRHTAATEDARLGWNEPMLRQKYGWGNDSKMPSHYVHLNLDDQRTRLLADAQRLAETASAAAPVANDAINALLGLLKQAASQLGQPTPA